jgi:hypothetical protein
VDIGHFKLVPDASLKGPAGGFAVVSPRLANLPRNTILQEVATVVQTITIAGLGIPLFESTDLHVHVEAYQWTVDEIRDQYKNFIYFERALDKMQPFNHQESNNPYAKSIRNLFSSVTEAYERLDRCSTIDCLKRVAQPGTTHDEIRSYKLNLVRHSEEDETYTFEFRGHHNSLDPKAVQMWLLATQNMVNGSFKSGAMPPGDERTLNEFAMAYFGDTGGDSFVDYVQERASY